MSKKPQRTSVRIEEDQYLEWENLESKESKDMVQFLGRHAKIDHLEQIVESHDNIEYIKRECPEIIDHETPTDELIEQWENSTEGAFEECHNEEKK